MKFELTTQEWFAIGGGLLALATAIAAFVRLYFAGQQLAQSSEQLMQLKKAEMANMMLKLDEMLGAHKEVYAKLRHYGEWTLSGGGPSNPEEWNELTVYMGLFERVNIMIKEKIIDAKVFNQLHGYRVQEIIDNEVIFQQKLVIDGADWENFLELMKTLGREPDPEKSRSVAPEIDGFDGGIAQPA